MRGFTIMITLMLNYVHSYTTPKLMYSNGKVNKFVKEAEIKHGRVAMLSTIIIPTIELLNGNHQGIYQLSSEPLPYQL